MPKDYQEVERIVEEWEPVLKQAHEYQLKAVYPSSLDELKQMLRVTLTTYGNARELQGIEKVEDYITSNRDTVTLVNIEDHIATLKQAIKTPPITSPKTEV